MPDDARREHRSDNGPAAGLGLSPFARHVWIVVGIGLLVIPVAMFFWQITAVLMLAFAGVLLAVLLRSLTDLLADFSRITPGPALALVVAGLGVVLGVSFWLLAADAVQQFTELWARLQEAIEVFRVRFARTALPEPVADMIPPARELLPEPGQVLAAAGGMFNSLVWVITAAVVIGFVGLYVAAEPEVYREGLVILLPPARRDRARQALHVLAGTLRRWLLGRLFSMAVVGVFSGLTLWFLGVPLAGALGLLAGVLNFIPYIGPVAWAVPAVLVALAQGLGTAAGVLGAYVVIQAVESYLLTPMVERRTVSLPPALTILVQVALGIIAGVVGLLLASPLTACVMVLVKMLYVEDVLGDATEIDARDHGPDPLESPPAVPLAE